MKQLLRQLGLGLAIIGLACGVLLLSDLGSRVKKEAQTNTQKVLKIAIMQAASQIIFDQGVAGIIEGLKESGYEDGKNIEVRIFNPQGDSNLANAIAREMTDGGYDLLATVTTPSLQVVANANAAGKVPHVFALVASPADTGVEISATDPLDHPSHLVGYGTRLPVISAFKYLKMINPQITSVGTVWNPHEVNSEVQIHDAREICQELEIQLVEANVDNTNGVAEAAASLIARGVEAMFVPGDITVLAAVDNVVQTAARARIPTFSLFPVQNSKGALFNVGANYYEVGRKTGNLIAEILQGRPVSEIPIENYVPESIQLSEAALEPLKNRDHWNFPEELKRMASIIVRKDGSVWTADNHPSEKTTANSPSPLAPKPGKTYHLGTAYFAPEPSLDDCYQGMLDELAAHGYKKGENLTLLETHAQGDSSNIAHILHNLESSPIDAAMLFSTPVMQGGLSVLRTKPFVFTYVTDPIAAGAGKSFTEHDPRLTGVGTMIPVAQAVSVIKEVFPETKKIGTLYNAGEVNSTLIVKLLREACQEAHIELEEVTIASTSEAIQAAQALASRQVSLVYLPNDNMAYQAYEGILKELSQAKIPVVNGDPSYIGKGIFASVGPGYYEAGKQAALKLIQVLNGQPPVTIPIENISSNKVVFDRKIARDLEILLDEAVLQRLETNTP